MITRRRVGWAGIVLTLLAMIIGATVWWTRPVYCLQDVPKAHVERVGDTVRVKGYIRAHILKDVRERDTIELTTPGGHLNTSRQIAGLASQIRITGRCDSACAAILVEYAHACIVPGTLTSINFHSVVIGQCTEEGISFKHDPVRTQTIVDRVVDPLRGRLAHLPTGNFWVSIPVEEFLEAYPDRLCPITTEVRAVRADPFCIEQVVVTRWHNDPVSLAHCARVG